MRLSNFEVLAKHIVDLVYRGATEVGVEFEGAVILRMWWRFPGLPVDSMPVDVEEQNANGAIGATGSRCSVVVAGGHGNQGTQG